jgi:hypothetical protein
MDAIFNLFSGEMTAFWCRNDVIKFLGIIIDRIKIYPVDLTADMSESSNFIILAYHRT